ncbi:MAG: addiction module toxin RelE [Gammaproteobacteria bacterium]|nr:type II toxin-antitoxin system RelE/ParE family toxin [Gammaproteobacteria bacterium]MYG83528.1 addiction module toxin RelE [Candidatus Dadabacteria bacterium]MXX05199.1 addiction module toxin RelE [Gammaproteobacteria bacterium]MYA37103.1 addiction module toxin RelE [Gammaproteobacteria bacterium]MYE28215.1 addiction module toxin RelE [Gammaproteobacteria bacterium]
MEWEVAFHDEFEEEFDGLSEAVQDAILVGAKLLEKVGPHLNRPHADTLNGSKYSNMKELRCNAENGVWRIAFAFDPRRTAILLTAGDKAGVNEKRFYKKLIAKADERFERHLAAQNETGKEGGSDGKDSTQKT